MKKHFLAALLLAGASAPSFAQAVLTDVNLNPLVNDAFVSVTCDTTAVTAMSGGANITWDYSTILTMSHYDTVVSIAYAGAPHASMFPGSTIASKTLSIIDTTLNFYIANSSKFSQNGYYHSTTQNAKFTNALDQLHYPVTYLDSFNDAYAGSISANYLGTPFVGTESGTAHVVVDGWGTLKLPGGVIDTGVLRVHTTQAFVDSTYIVSMAVGAGFTINTYSWYMAGYHSALLTIAYLDQVSGPTGTGGPIHQKTVAYAKRYPLSIATMHTIENSLALYPNPATSELNIQFDGTSNEKVRISLLDMTSREVAEISNVTASGTQHITYNTSSLAKGMYFVRIQSGSETMIKKVVIQ